MRLVRSAEIVVLVGAVVYAEARADGGLSLECRGRPRQAEAGREVVAVGRIIRRARRAEASATHEVHHLGAPQHLVHHAVVLVAHAQVQVRLGRSLISSCAKPIQKVRRMPPTGNAPCTEIESTTLFMKFASLV